MYQKKTVKAFSIVAIVLSSLGILFSIIATLVVQTGFGTLAFIIGIISWAILLSTLWALKKNYDEWDSSDRFISSPTSNDSTPVP